MKSPGHGLLTLVLCQVIHDEEKVRNYYNRKTKKRLFPLILKVYFDKGAEQNDKAIFSCEHIGRS